MDTAFWIDFLLGQIFLHWRLYFWKWLQLIDGSFYLRIFERFKIIIAVEDGFE